MFDDRESIPKYMSWIQDVKVCVLFQHEACSALPSECVADTLTRLDDLYTHSAFVQLCGECPSGGGGQTHLPQWPCSARTAE